jgi:hypothetical protein
VNVSLISLVAMAVVAVPTYAQRETVPEAIARGATGRVRTAPSGKAPTLPELLAETDLIVQGTMGGSRAYLSEDRADVYTDHVLLNTFILHGTIAPQASKVPGQIPSLTITQLGGALQFGGVIFTQTEHGLPPLRPGMQGIFLLTRVSDKYLIAKVFYGALEIRDGKVFPLARPEAFLPEYRGKEVDDAIRDLLENVRALGK